MLHALLAILGEETFFEAYRTFFDRWTHKHPTPYDFFNTVEDVAGRELDWFWRGAFYESWAFDQAIASVETTGDGVVVIVRDERRLPLPVLLEVTYADGRTVERRVGVAPWLKGKRTVEVTLPPGTVTRVQIDPEQRLPDVDRSDNVWTAGD
jgi:aminopeptidase N